MESVEESFIQERSIEEGKTAYVFPDESHETLLDVRNGPIVAPRPRSDWAMAQKVVEMQERDLAAGYAKRELGVTWQNLNVEVLSAEASVNENFFSQFNLLQLVRDFRQKKRMRSILQDSHGCVKPGEMLLVLGRPGSGCTTFLKTITGHLGGLTMDPNSTIHYEGISFEDMIKHHRGEVAYNKEVKCQYLMCLQPNVC